VKIVPPAPATNELEIVPDVARTGKRRQVAVCFAYTYDARTPSHRREATRHTAYRVNVTPHRGQRPRHRRPSTTWPGVTSETLGSRRRFRRFLVALIVGTAAVAALLLVLFGAGGDVIEQVAAALAAHVGN
jgi:hypothetical protein